MPFNFSGNHKSSLAKMGVVFDGDTFVVADGSGQTVTSTLPGNTIFVKNPVRSATGVWSVTLKETVNEIMDLDVVTLLPSGDYLSTQLNLTTVDSLHRLVLHWTFNVAGTPTDLPSSGSPQFVVFICYAETSNK